MSGCDSRTVVSESVVRTHRLHILCRWNTELFPDPAAFLKTLKDRGLKSTLNVHPADGVRPFEKLYPAMCEALGRDPAENLVSSGLMDTPSRHQGCDDPKLGAFPLAVTADS